MPSLCQVKTYHSADLSGNLGDPEHQAVQISIRLGTSLVSMHLRRPISQQLSVPGSQLVAPRSCVQVAQHLK